MCLRLGALSGVWWFQVIVQNKSRRCARRCAGASEPLPPVVIEEHESLFVSSDQHVLGIENSFWSWGWLS